MKIKQGDSVKILLGKDRGRTGTVLKTYPKTLKVLVEGLNLYKKHIKARRKGEEGGIVTKPRPLLVSKMALLCPNCQKATRVGIQTTEDGKKYRLCKKCKTVIDQKLTHKKK